MDDDSPLRWAVISEGGPSISVRWQSLEAMRTADLTSWDQCLAEADRDGHAPREARGDPQSSRVPYPRGA